MLGFPTWKSHKNSFSFEELNLAEHLTSVFASFFQSPLQSCTNQQPPCRSARISTLPNGFVWILTKLHSRWIKPNVATKHKYFPVACARRGLLVNTHTSRGWSEAEEKRPRGPCGRAGHMHAVSHLMSLHKWPAGRRGVDRTAAETMSSLSKLWVGEWSGEGSRERWPRPPYVVWPWRRRRRTRPTGRWLRRCCQG
jgi:hypothetical protein